MVGCFFFFFYSKRHLLLWLTSALWSAENLHLHCRLHSPCRAKKAPQSWVHLFDRHQRISDLSQLSNRADSPRKWTLVWIKPADVKAPPLTCRIMSFLKQIYPDSTLEPEVASVSKPSPGNTVKQSQLLFLWRPNNSTQHPQTPTHTPSFGTGVVP